MREREGLKKEGNRERGHKKEVKGMREKGMGEVLRERVRGKRRGEEGKE